MNFSVGCGGNCSVWEDRAVEEILQSAELMTTEKAETAGNSSIGNNRIMSHR